MASSYSLVLLPGDGIGPEVVATATDLLDALSQASGVTFRTVTERAGGDAIDHDGTPLSDRALAACKDADAVLLGAVGGAAWDHHTGPMRPESGLLQLRKELGVFANLRPVAVPDALAAASPLREEAVRGTDLLVVRELTGGIYFGEPRGREGVGDAEVAWNTMRYSRAEVARLARVAFTRARRRRGKVTSVDKANVLVVSQLWRDVVREVHEAEFSDIALEHMYVDNAAMQLVLNPRQFDVIVTGNLFGDILSDAAATLGGSLGLLPSASVGGPVGLFEPVHGSAPDLAGKDAANPIAALLSAGMMLDELGEPRLGEAVRHGVEAALQAGLRTGDLWREGLTRVGTQALATRIRGEAVAWLSR